MVGGRGGGCVCTDTQFSCATAGTSSASGYTMAEHCFKLCIGFRPTPHVSYLSGISATQNMSFSSKMAGIYEIKLNHANMFKVLETIPLTKVSHRTMPSIGGTGNYISPMMEWSCKVMWQMGWIYTPITRTHHPIYQSAHG